MKKRFAVFLLLLAAAGYVGIAQAQPGVNVSLGIQVNSASDFYQPLQSYGQWVPVNPYGRCWHPAQTPQGWRPYENGEWVWTDAGWYWQSDEPWSWACYHYGSWVSDPTYGWCWIPGTEWAPAWVTWRYSDSYVGWAPCGPGLSVLPAALFVFADVHNFSGHRFSHGSRDLIVNNTTIINNTRVVNNFPRETRRFDGREQRIVTNPGPGIDHIQRATGQRFTAQPVENYIRQTRAQDHRSEARPTDRSNERPGQQPRDQQPRTEPNRPPVAPAPEQRPEPRPGFSQNQRENNPRQDTTPRPNPEVTPRPQQPLTPTGRQNGEDLRNRQPQRPAQPNAETRPNIPQTPAPTPPPRVAPAPEPKQPALQPTGRQSGDEQLRNRQPQPNAETRPAPTPSTPPRVTPAPESRPAQQQLTPTGRASGQQTPEARPAPATRPAPEVKPAPPQPRPEQKPPEKPNDKNDKKPDQQ